MTQFIERWRSKPLRNRIGIIVLLIVVIQIAGIVICTLLLPVTG